MSEALALSPLLDREAAVAAVDGALERTAGGEGVAVLFEGAPGMGKTRLLDETLRRARAGALSAVRVSGAEGEQVLAWGVVHQLGHRLLAQRSADERERILAGLPAGALRLFGGGELAGDSGAQGELSLAHAMFTALDRAAETGPLVVCVDDLHWCDSSSLQTLLYLLARLDDLPLTLVMARRPSEPGPEAMAAASIAAHPRVAVQSVAPLSPPAVAALAETWLGRATGDEVIDACLRTTGGNPFYLQELLFALGEEPAAEDDAGLVARLRLIVPRTVSLAVAVRIGRLGPEAVALARAVAVLGDGSLLRRAATLAEIDPAAAGRIADGLVHAHILAPGPEVGFAHPLVRRVVDEEIGAGERSRLHLRAARLLHDEHESAQRVAAQLLAAQPSGEPWVVERLLEAAREAVAQAAPESAVRSLRRALSEPPPEDRRLTVLTELGSAEASTGDADAVEHLAAAAALAPTGAARARLALARSRALHAMGRHAESAAVIDEGLAELDVPEPEGRDGQVDAVGHEVLALHDELQTMYAIVALLAPGLAAEAERRTAVVLGRTEGPRTPGQHAMLALAGGWASVNGGPREVSVALAEQGWDNGRLLQEETSRGLAWTAVTGAFTQSGEFARSVDVADAAIADARRRSDPLALATALYVRGCPRLMLGDIAGSVADLQIALRARRYGWHQYSRAACAYCVGGLVLAGQLDEAESLLDAEGELDAQHDIEAAALLGARAQLHLARGRFAEALADARAMRVASPVVAWFVGSWRDVGVQAALALDRREAARELAADELDRGRRSDIGFLTVSGLRLSGLVAGGEAGIELLREAVQTGDADAPDLTTMLAMLDLGAALRRANRRAEARPWLERAADAALRGGALAVHERARTELAAAGARPRRDVLRSGKESLTASERRIADLAAGGLSNREIAQILFVTPKTVEYHLRNVYLKLGIGRRAGLATALAP